MYSLFCIIVALIIALFQPEVFIPIIAIYIIYRLHKKGKHISCGLPCCMYGWTDSDTEKESESHISDTCE